MRHVRNIWRNIYDVRPGEGLRALFMFLYLLFVLFAYYILKPVSQAMFLNRFDVDDLPILIILVAVGAGGLAYLYSKAAMRTSLSHAVTATMTASVGCLVLIWWLLGRNLPWMLYAFNIFVGVFSIVLVTQGWLVAGNVFNSREARRIFPLLGMALVIGAAFGGEFTRRTATLVGTRNLVLASAFMVLLAWAAFLLVRMQRGVALARARAAESEELDFSVRDIARDIGGNRHLQIIIAIMAMMFIVDVLVNFQFQAMAKARYRGDELTVFLGTFYGLWLNLTEFVVQFLVTSAVVSRFGVAGVLQIMPVSILAASSFAAAAPGVLTASAVRLTEACTRYTLNKTGMELLYMPLPRELRNRIKAFIDIFFDRMSRGIGGLLLILFTRVLDLGIREITYIVMGLTLPWMYISVRARREYIATVRRRLAARRLDLEHPRVAAQDRETVRLLEETALGANPRQAVYALSLLGDVRDYDAAPLLARLAGSAYPAVRARMYELAREARWPGLSDRAREETEAGGPAAPAAVEYLLATSPERLELARRFLNAPSAETAAGAVEALAGDPETAFDLITHEWLAANAASPDPARRALAATAVGARGDQGTEALYALLRDPDPGVVRAAARAAGRLRSRAYLHLLVDRLPDARVRGEVIEALARFGTQICGTLGDLLQDASVPAAIRRQVPRVLRLIPAQRSVDILLGAVGHDDLAIRSAVLKALNRLRESSPELRFDDRYVTGQIYREARYYFELSAVLAPLRGRAARPRSAVDLLVRTLEERLRQALERVFRLLGLRYPPREIYSTYLALSRRREEETAAAIEFLDSVLERNLKKILLPLLDAPDHLHERARDLFGMEFANAESALRELIRTRDPWLAACAMAAAAELQLRSLAPDIAAAAGGAEPELDEVARSAREVLA